MPGESTTYDCSCVALPGTTPPATTQYVVSINDLVGQITLGNTGAIVWTSVDNTLYASLSAAAGLGSVTSVAITSPNDNLTVAGSPITTNGTITLNLAKALSSISGLVTAADKMIYTTALDTYAVTDLTAFGRTLVANANAADTRTDLGLVIGTDVQAFSSDLTDFVTNASWVGSALTLGGALTVTGALTASSTLAVTGAVTLSSTLGVTGAVTAASFSGAGTSLTALNGSNISTGTVSVDRGGTGLGSYTIGDIIYASGTTTLSKLPAGAAGTFLRFAGAGAAPVVSTLILPNAATVGDIFSSSTTNTMSRITAVATGNVLISGGVATLPSWGKVTTSHTTGIAASGTNSDITAMTQDISFSGELTFNGVVTLGSGLQDGTASLGGAGYLLTSNGSTTVWSNQITLDTLALNTRLSVEGTITAGGTTGAQTINKPSGTVNFAAAASSLVVTNSLCTTSDRVLATVVTNDSTMKSVSCVTTNGAFTLTANAAATAETAVYWVLIRVS